jgi:uncharacterized Zn finger protein
MSKNWWAAAWVEKMERLAERTRFAQGEGYAKGNQVQRCRLEGRTVIAMAQGRGESPYTVRITFDPFSREQWDQLFANIRDWRGLAAALAAGDLPLEVQTAFAKAKLRFMPERFADLHLECACADWLKPCKHLVAAWLRFGRDFERDPLLLFQLRGMERDGLLAFLRSGAAPAAPEPETEEEIEEEIAPIRLEALPADPDAYWAVRELPPDRSLAGEKRLLDDDIFAKLGPAPFAGWRAIEPQLHRIYDAVYEFAMVMLRK